MTPTLGNIYREASIIVMVTFLSEATRCIKQYLFLNSITYRYIKT